MSFMYGGHVRANGIRQHYLRYGGHGKAVVILPGIVSTATLWDHVGRWIGESHDCYVLDIRGRGLSESGPHLDYRFDVCAQDVADFVRVLGIEDPILVGHSMGGRIALKVAASAAIRVCKLILLDPPMSGPGRRLYPVPISRTLSLLRAARLGDDISPFSPTGLSAWPADMQRLRAEWLPTCDERAVYVSYDEFVDHDPLVDFSKLNVPTHLVCAARGETVSDREIHEVIAVAPHVDVVRLADAGHQMQVENFPGLCEVLTSALGPVAAKGECK